MKRSKSQPGIRIAMVLAAGYGTRMGNLTEGIPKPLLPLNGKRIIEVVLQKLAAEGIERAVVNLHYLPHKMREFLGDGNRYGLELIFSEEPELLGSGGGIAKAEPYFDGETILAANADVLCNLNTRELYRYHCQSNPLATMAVLPSRNNKDYSLALFDEDNNLVAFLRKNQDIPPQLQSGIFTGYQILSHQARMYLKPVNQSIISKFYRKVLDEGYSIKIFPFRGQWIDVGTKEFYLSLRQKIRSGEVVLETFLQ